MSGLFLLYHYRGIVSGIAATLLLIAAFFTKQSALIAITPALIAFCWLDKRRALLCGAGVALGIGAGVALLQWLTDGWFGFYVFAVPAGHSMDYSNITDFWKVDLAQKIGILCAVTLACLMVMRAESASKARWYGAFLVGFIGCVYVSRLHGFGWLNVLIPAHVALALLAGLSLKYWRALKECHAVLLVSVLLCVQMASLLYNPIALVPRAESYAQGKKFMDEIAKIEGDIFMPEIQFVQTRVGKKSFTYGMAGFDVMRAELGSKNHVKEQLQRDIDWALKNHQFAAIITGRMIRLREKDDYYKFDRNIDYPQEYVTGAIPRTSTGVFVPK